MTGQPGAVPPESGTQGAEGGNMYGFQPCPKCGERYRYEFGNCPGVIECDDCGFKEPITQRVGVE